MKLECESFLRFDRCVAIRADIVQEAESIVTSAILNEYRNGMDPWACIISPSLPTIWSVSTGRKGEIREDSRLTLDDVRPVFDKKLADTRTALRIAGIVPQQPLSVAFTGLVLPIGAAKFP